MEEIARQNPLQNTTEEEEDERHQTPSPSREGSKDPLLDDRQARGEHSSSPLPLARMHALRCMPYKWGHCSSQCRPPYSLLAPSIPTAPACTYELPACVRQASSHHDALPRTYTSPPPPSTHLHMQIDSYYALLSNNNAPTPRNYRRPSAAMLVLWLTVRRR